MNILYIGDIMGAMGIDVIEDVLADLVKQESIDIVLAQAENVSDGKGLNLKDYKRLKDLGVDGFTGGNWTIFNDEIWPALADPKEPIAYPANYPKHEHGPGYKYVEKNGKKILVVSLLGQIVGKDSKLELDNPLQTIDDILEKESNTRKDAVIVNFHGDFSSQKVVIGHYLDGKVTAVVGDHWHVPTADARVLPKGTAHVSDVGMCGALNGSLGVRLDSIIPRWRDNTKTRNTLESKGEKQFNAVLVKASKDGLASSIKSIQKYY